MRLFYICAYFDILYTKHISTIYIFENTFIYIIFRDGDSSPWTRTRVLILLDSDSSPTHSDSRHADLTWTSGLGPDSANCAAEDFFQVYLTSNVKTLESETATDLPLTRHGYFTYR